MGSARKDSADPNLTQNRARSSCPARPTIHPVIPSQSALLVSTLLCHPCGKSQRTGSPASVGRIRLITMFAGMLEASP